MGKMIFYVTIANLCFGQSIWLKENPKITLPAPISTYIRPTNTGNSLTESNPPFQPIIANSLQNCFYANALMLQVAADSLQPKTSFWKQAGIYGLEFVGAGIGTAFPSYYSLIIIATNFMDNPQDSTALKPTLCFYLIGNIVLGSSSTWASGKILGQEGSWWKSAIGTGVGSALGILAYHKPGCDDWRLISIFLITPPLGAVIGYNW